MGAGQPFFAAANNQLIHSPQWHNTPLSPYPSIFYAEYEVDQATSFSVTGRWLGRSSRRPSPLLIFGAILTTIGIAMLVLQCFRSLAENRKIPLADRRLAEGGDGCGVSPTLPDRTGLSHHLAPLELVIFFMKQLVVAGD